MTSDEVDIEFRRIFCAFRFMLEYADMLVQNRTPGYPKWKKGEKAEEFEYLQSYTASRILACQDDIASAFKSDPTYKPTL